MDFIRKTFANPTENLVATQAMKEMLAQTQRELAENPTDALARKEREQERIDAAVQAVTRTKQAELEKLRNSMLELERTHIMLKTEHADILDKYDTALREISFLRRNSNAAEAEVELIRQEVESLRQQLGPKVKTSEIVSTLRQNADALLADKLELVARVKHLEQNNEDLTRLLSTAEGDLRRREGERLRMIAHREDDQRAYAQFVEWTLKTLMRYASGLMNSHKYLQEQVEQAEARRLQSEKDARRAEEEAEREAENILDSVLQSMRANMETTDLAQAKTTVQDDATQSAAEKEEEAVKPDVPSAQSELKLPQPPPYHAVAPALQSRASMTAFFDRTRPTVRQLKTSMMASHRSVMAFADLASENAEQATAVPDCVSTDDKSRLVQSVRMNKRIARKSMMLGKRAIVFK